MLKHKLVLGSFLTIILTAFSLFLSIAEVSAATLTVETTADDTVSDGNCTLREAIININTQADAHPDCTFVGAYGTDDTIEFAITGTADFTNSGQNGYTISLATNLPDIQETVIINGYSQLGAVANTNVSPNPLNGVLLVQIDGSALANGTNGLQFVGGAGGSANSEIRGLILNGFGGGDAVLIDADGIIIQGNYIGTNPSGTMAATTAEANNIGITNNNGSPDSNSGVLIGGLDPEDRNILSGQEDAAAYPVNGWTIQGNYIGIAADGVTPVPNATVNSPGSLSIDDCDGVLVGGTANGAANVISGNTSYGVAPDNATNTRIEGNLIGTDYTGTVALPNLVGIITSRDMAGSVIGGTTAAARNIISGNTVAGIVSGATPGLSIQGNYIGLDIQGDDPLPNDAGLIIADDGTNVGGSVAARNVISGNTEFNLSFQGTFFVSQNNSASFNYIGTDSNGNLSSTITSVQGEGVRISAQASGNLIQSNRIAGNRDNGVAIRQTTVIPLSVNPLINENNAILSNEIYSNNTAGPISNQEGLTMGLGIDLYEATINGVPTFLADVNADSYNGLEETVNDSGDSDTGPNNYMNFPVLNSASQNNTTVSVNLNLDAADTTDPDGNYRIELFANDNADPSGYGEGQTYLGFADVANGNGQDITFTVPSGTDLTNKVLTATTTAYSSATDSGFGSTSEFSLALQDNITVISPAVESNESGSLADTGFNVLALSLLAGGMMTAGGVMTLRRLRA